MTHPMQLTLTPEEATLLANTLNFALSADRGDLGDCRPDVIQLAKKVDYLPVIALHEELAAKQDKEAATCFAVAIDGDRIPVPMDFDQATRWTGVLQEQFPGSTVGIVYI